MRRKFSEYDSNKVKMLNKSSYFNGRRLKKLGISIGTRCNFLCSHCMFSGKSWAVDLQPEEIKVLQAEIQKYAPRELLFTGGEPTLYIDTINKLISAHPSPHATKISVTTNGHFADTLSSAKKVLKSFSFINRLQLSYDKFHGKFLPMRKVGLLYEACRGMGLRFGVLMAIQSPLDIVSLKELRQIGEFDIILQKILPQGKAKNNRVDYKYPEFDKSVLGKRCPNLGRIIYAPGKGFSVCCCSLVLSQLKTKVAHVTIEKHFGSEFYKAISSFTFGEMVGPLDLSNVNFDPKLSSECSMCEYVFRKYPADVINSNLSQNKALIRAKYEKKKS
ncbi:MAG: radical SAM protein [Elusimicrobiota bacterium]|nr:radical SAM protein [Elusimicrobiota bacterium]